MDTRQLQELFGEFLQTLGLHRPDQVPTGFSLSLSEMFALLALSAEAQMSQQVLAEQLHLEKSTVSRLITHLEQRGMGEAGARPARYTYIPTAVE
jgi:DNA-binding MarR family transcriptional regulator